MPRSPGRDCSPQLNSTPHIKESHHDRPYSPGPPAGGHRAAALHRRGGAAGTGLDTAAFWSGVDQLVHELAPRNRELLAERDRLQVELDNWHRPIPVGHRSARLQSFWKASGYLQPVPGQVQASTAGVDREIAEQDGPQAGGAGPQRPLRLNAANAAGGRCRCPLWHRRPAENRWRRARQRATTPPVAPRLVALARQVLDGVAPSPASHRDATAYRIQDGRWWWTSGALPANWDDPTAFVGFQGRCRRTVRGAAAP